MAEIPWPRTARWLSNTNSTPSDPLEEEVVALYTDLRTPVLRYLAALGLPIHDGEDILQETFFALYQHLAAGKPRDHIRGWIFRVARNLALKRFSRQDLQLSPIAELTLEESRFNPEQLAVRQQQDAAVRRVVNALPDLDRQCLLLRAEGLRYREIASVLDVSLGSVSLALARALEKLARVGQK